MISSCAICIIVFADIIETFLEKMQRTFGGNPIFKAASGKAQEGTFTVQHYAGNVTKK